MHRGGQLAERLVRANVRSGLFAADVLLARSEREHESALAIGIRSLAGKPPGHLPHVLVPRSNHTGERPAVARWQPETLAFHRDDVRFCGWLDDTQRNAFRHDNDKHGTRSMGELRERRVRFDYAEKIRRLHDDR